MPSPPSCSAPRTATSIFRELIPNAMAPIVVAATLNVARAILTRPMSASSATASSRPRRAGATCSTTRSNISSSAPWLAIFPGLMITAAVTSFNFMGDGLRDALDARLDH